MILLGQGEQRLHEQGVLRDVHGDLPRLSLEDGALHADDVADVQLFELLIVLRAHVVAAEIELQLAVAVRDVPETRLAHHALGHQPARDGHALSFVCVVVRADGARRRGALVGRELKRILARLFESGELVEPDLADFAYLLFGRSGADGFSCVVAHLISLILYRIFLPPGASISTTSPFFLPMSAAPRGDSLLMRLSSAFASVVPTI